MTIEELAELVALQIKAYKRRHGYDASNVVTEVVPGRKYIKVDGPSNGHGYLMVEIATGEIYGIRGYGQVDKGCYYGTLATADHWDFGDYITGPRQVGR